MHPSHYLFGIFCVITIITILSIWLEYKVQQQKRDLCRQSKKCKQWFEGLKWAESQFHKISPSAEHLIREYPYGRDDSFDQGACDYIRHYEQNRIYLFLNETVPENA